jgi:hypothetical protein
LSPWPFQVGLEQDSEIPSPREVVFFNRNSIDEYIFSFSLGLFLGSDMRSPPGRRLEMNEPRLGIVDEPPA